jgi:hypothetical protein
MCAEASEMTQCSEDRDVTIAVVLFGNITVSIWECLSYWELKDRFISLQSGVICWEFGEILRMKGEYWVLGMGY